MQVPRCEMCTLQAETNRWLKPETRLMVVNNLDGKCEGGVDGNMTEQTSTNSPRPGDITDDPQTFVNLSSTGRLIGIDMGTKTLGLALSDVMRSIASPLETIKRRKFSVDIVRLLELGEEHTITGWVLGQPLNLDGSAGPRVQATNAFARNLAARSPLPILLWDERLSTVAAERVLLEADTSRQRRGEVIDKMAAGIILQGALDRFTNL